MGPAQKGPSLGGERGLSARRMSPWNWMTGSLASKVEDASTWNHAGISQTTPRSSGFIFFLLILVLR